MPALSTDKIRKGASNISTTLQVSISDSDTSLTPASVALMPTDTAIDISIDRVDSSGTATPAKWERLIGVISGGNIVTLLRAQDGSTAQPHSTGAVIEMMPTGKWSQDLADALLAQHNQDGSHGAVTAASLSVTSHLDVNDSSTAIRDSSDNELVKFVKTASAVNEVTVTNAATAGAPSVSATGGDTNIDLRLIPKGTGNVKRGATGGAIDWWEELGRTTLSVAGDTMSVTGLPARRYLKILFIGIATGGTLDTTMRFNNDSTTNYVFQVIWNNAGVANYTGATSASSIALEQGTVATGGLEHHALDVVNIATQRKIVSGVGSYGTTPAASFFPSSASGLWGNTVDQINRVDIINSGTGDFAIGSEVVVLGHD